MAQPPISLISGINGFAGRHLADRLLHEGHKVAGIPRDLLLDAGALKEFIEEASPDYIFHLAAYGNSYDHSQDDEIFLSNVFKTYILLSASLEIPYKAFINVSTSSVTLPKMTMYSGTKLAGEALAKTFAGVYKKPIITVRPYSITGIGEQENHLIPTLIRSCLDGEEMPFVPDPMHDFINVADFVNALYMVSQKIEGYKEIPIGTGYQYANQQVKALVERVTGKKANIKEVDSLRSYDNHRWVADPSVMQSLGWESCHSLEETIKQMVDYRNGDKK